MKAPEPAVQARAPRTQLVVAAVVAVAFAGYFTGIGGFDGEAHHSLRSTLPAGRPQASAANAPAPADVMPAMSYEQLDAVGAGRRGDRVQRLPVAIPAASSDGAPVAMDPEQRRRDLVARAERRAYNGAPPVIPHPVDTVSARSCLACHRTGMRVGDRVASRIPHAEFVNCLQCHAEASSAVPAPATGTGELATTWRGLQAPQGGPRAYESAPPQIPHSTWMWQNCLSCHGPLGPSGMQTTHPERQSCKQCHAPFAQLEQLPGGGR